MKLVQRILAGALVAGILALTACGGSPSDSSTPSSSQPTSSSPTSSQPTSSQPTSSQPTSSQPNSEENKFPSAGTQLAYKNSKTGKLGDYFAKGVGYMVIEEVRKDGSSARVTIGSTGKDYIFLAKPGTLDKTDIEDGFMYRDGKCYILVEAEKGTKVSLFLDGDSEKEEEARAAIISLQTDGALTKSMGTVFPASRDMTSGVTTGIISAGSKKYYTETVMRDSDTYTYYYNYMTGVPEKIVIKHSNGTSENVNVPKFAMVPTIDKEIKAPEGYVEVSYSELNSAAGIDLSSISLDDIDTAALF